ncbi:MAG: hypothetical protein KF685_02315 [Acidobacteria bacterium]|nr:hypothetical protein [Acidobacteriota bacterium]
MVSMIVGVRTNKMINDLLFLLMAIMLCHAATFAQADAFDPSTLSEKGKQAYSSLSKVRRFAIGGVGYSAERSSGEASLEILIEEKNAIRAFSQLITDGTLEGGLYGLFGLKMLGCECYEAELTRYKELVFGKNSREEFTIQSGCSVIEVVEEADKKMVLTLLMGEWFEKEARLKNCLRLTKGRPQDLAKCYQGVQE